MKTNHSQSSLTSKEWQRERDATQALRIAVSDYLSQSSVRSVAYLARKSGVPYSTVRRIAQGRGTADIAKVIPILGVIMERKEYLAFVKVFYPQLYHVLQNTFTPNQQPSHDQHKNHSFDPAANYILHLCIGEQGMSKEDVRMKVKMRYGHYGLTRLRDLEAAGYLVMLPDKSRLKCDKFKKPTATSVLQNIELLTNLFNTNYLDTDLATLDFVTEKVNHKGLSLIKQAGIDYLKKVVITQQKHAGGDLHFFVTLMQNLYCGGLPTSK
ncbi:MAG: hypothetical protein OXC40_01470 [Proteobacteria bacterium]|nr:hypothetical protein [Pseudomonadota bacterium]